MGRISSIAGNSMMRKLWFARLAAAKIYDPDCTQKKGHCKGKTRGGSVIVKKSGFGSVGPRDGKKTYKQMLNTGRSSRKAGDDLFDGERTASHATIAGAVRREIQDASNRGETKPARVQFSNPIQSKSSGPIMLKTVSNAGGKVQTRKIVNIEDATGVGGEAKEKELRNAVVRQRNLSFAKKTAPTVVHSKKLSTKGVSKEERKAATASNAKLSGNDKRRAGKSLSKGIVLLGNKFRNQARSAALKGKRPARQK